MKQNIILRAVPKGMLALFSSCIFITTPAIAEETPVLNALVITDTEGEIHRIAIDGNDLRVFVSDGNLVIANSGIKVEYKPAEIERFSFEHYDFSKGALYKGSKETAAAPLFEMAVIPVIGAETGSIAEIRIAPPAGALPGLRSYCQEPVTLSRLNDSEEETFLSISAADMKSMATEDSSYYLIVPEGEEEPGVYTLHIPHGYFEDSERALNREQTVTWMLSDQKPPTGGVEEVTASPVLTLRRDGHTLYIGGLGTCPYVTLYDTSGAVKASALVSAMGTACLDLSGLCGIYLLHVGSTTLKLTI